MGKVRKIRVGDFVSYAGKEYVIIKKSKLNFRLLPRQIRTGGAITTPRTRVKLADQSWRSNLQRGDAISLFLGAQWIPALVYGRNGKKLEVQPCLNNYTMRVHQDSGIISKSTVPNHHALWVKDKIQPVIIDGACHIERGSGLVFPWSYTSPGSTRVEVSGPIRTPLTTLTFAKYKTSGFPMKMYNNLSTCEIMHDINSKQQEHPEVLQQIAHQWCWHRLPIYPNVRYFYGLRYYITQALAHEDNRRVQEMLSVGENDDIFHKSEWAVRTHLSHPYIEVELTVKGDCLEVQLYHSGIQIDKTSDSVREILRHISLPMLYAPDKLTVDSSPEMQYVLSRMLGMEQTPVELLSTRKIHRSKILFNLSRGFCDPEMRVCGGQLNMPFMNFQKLFVELMKRSPMRTLIVVETSALPLWKDFNIYYGRKRKFEPITVTTRAMFSKISRRTRVFDSAERLVMLISTDWSHAAALAARKFRCKVKWAIGCGSFTSNSAIFESREMNKDLCIELSKKDMEEMGIEFPQFVKQEVIFNVKEDKYKDFMQRLPPSLRNNPVDVIDNMRGRNFLSLYLEHPELVPIRFRGDKLDAIEATISNISDKFGVAEDLLKSRAQETCSVCLETITDAAVTPCGHIFCSVCMKELQTRQIKCPMCRSRIPNFLKLSDKDTVGKIEVIRGIPYRVSENEDWGKKIEFLKLHKDATFLVGEKLLKRKLKQVFKKTQILTSDDIKDGAKPASSKIISLKAISADFLEKFIGTPWAKDFTVFELKYRLSNKPFQTEFY